MILRAQASSLWCQPKNRGVYPPNHPMFNRVFHEINHPFWGTLFNFWKHPFYIGILINHYKDPY